MSSNASVSRTKSQFVVYLKAAGVTFLWLIFAYTLLAFLYMFGVIPTPDQELRLAYALGFWLSVPVAFMMTGFVLPLVLLSNYLDRKFGLPELAPLIAIFPVSFALHFISIFALPVLLIPILLSGAFLFPVAFQGGRWGLVELGMSSLNISFAFTVLWTRVKKYPDAH